MYYLIFRIYLLWIFFSYFCSFCMASWKISYYMLNKSPVGNNIFLSFINLYWEWWKAKKNPHDCIEVLKKSLHQFTDHYYGRKFLFCQDNEAIHNAKVTKEWFWKQEHDCYRQIFKLSRLQSHCESVKQPFKLCLWSKYINCRWQKIPLKIHVCNTKQVYSGFTTFPSLLPLISWGHDYL